MTENREILWRPAPAQAEATHMADFIRWLAQRHGLSFDRYPDLWRWSVTETDAFWRAIWDYFEIGPDADTSVVLARDAMPGAEWFPHVSLNFAGYLLRHAAQRPDAVALIVQSETFGETRLTWGALAQRVANMADTLRSMGVGTGDRVAAILPNTESAIIAFLATASLGAVWSLCAPEMGHVAVLDRFRQIGPKVLIAQDGHTNGGTAHDLRPVLAQIAGGLPTLAHQIRLPVAGDLPEGMTAWDTAISGQAVLTPQPVGFDHPLWIVYSSGTTGSPKPIVHGHGGALLEGCKQSLHMDVGPQDRFCWMTSSGWIMWNCQLPVLARGACVALFDGAPNRPDLMALWRFAERHGLTHLGAGAAFFDTCRKADIRPRDEVDLSALRMLGATGSPLSEDAYRWVYGAVKPDIWLAPISGGTDFAGAFVGGNPMLPVRIGEMQCKFLGNAVYAFDDQGNDLVGPVGELVCTRPLPSMPLFFWGDEGGQRLHESYFDTYPGIWRHGDWIAFTPEGGSVIYGRSDATINRKGLRLGSAEIYQAVEALPEIVDSLVVDLEFLGRESYMPLFVVPARGVVLDAALHDKIRAAIRAAVSARFLPDEIVAVAAVPRTLSGKKLEVPVKKLFLGAEPDTVVNRDSMANPDSFAVFVALAQRHAAGAPLG